MEDFVSKSAAIAASVGISLLIATSVLLLILSTV